MKYLIVLLLIIFNANAALVGKKAPVFSLKNQDNKIIDLADAKGKYVVLEWLNHGCPFVKKHYNSGNMQKIQKIVISKNVLWYSIISSAEGRQGHSTPAEAKSDIKRVGSYATEVLLDSSGEVGQSYGAKTTPHMFIIDPKGEIVYEGAIDSIASADSDDIKDSTNYILAAFEDIKKGQRIKKQKSRPYGCSVKY